MSIDPEKMQEAVSAVMNDKISLRKACALYGIKSPTSLSQRVNGIVPIRATRGRNLKYLNSGIETGIVEFVHFRASRGMCIDGPELRYIIADTAKRFGIAVPSNFPDRTWVARFTKRHSSISWRRSQLLDIARFKGSSVEVVDHYFANLAAIFGNYSPATIWNCDETSVCAQGRRPPRVICSKGLRANTVRSTDRENVSIMACISASGQALPPMYIYAGKRRKLEWSDGALPGATFAVTDSSNIQGKLFQAWLDWFVTKVGPERPQLLLLDGHFAHLGHGVLTFAKANGIDIFVLPPHTSHFLQPADGAPFSVFKAAVERSISDFPLNNRGAYPNRDHLAAITTGPWLKAMTSNNITGAFRKCGIVPLDRDIMARAIIGRAPDKAALAIPTPNLVAAVETITPLTVTKRLRAQWARQGLDSDAVLSAHHNICRFLSSWNATTAPKVGTHVSEKDAALLPRGGFLITRDDIMKLIEDANDSKLLKKEEKEARRVAKLVKQSLKQTEKLGRQGSEEIVI